MKKQGKITLFIIFIRIKKVCHIFRAYNRESFHFSFFLRRNWSNTRSQKMQAFLRQKKNRMSESCKWHSIQLETHRTIWLLRWSEKQLKWNRENMRLLDEQMMIKKFVVTDLSADNKKQRHKNQKHKIKEKHNNDQNRN